MRNVRFILLPDSTTIVALLGREQIGFYLFLATPYYYEGKYYHYYCEFYPDNVGEFVEFPEQAQAFISNSWFLYKSNTISI